MQKAYGDEKQVSLVLVGGSCVRYATGVAEKK